MIVGNRLSDCEPSGAARRGSGLLTGLLRCRRCGRMLRVFYKGADGEVVRYACPELTWTTKKRGVSRSAVGMSMPQSLGSCCAWFNPRR